MEFISTNYQQHYIDILNNNDAKLLIMNIFMFAYVAVIIHVCMCEFM